MREGLFTVHCSVFSVQRVTVSRAQFGPWDFISNNGETSITAQMDANTGAEPILPGYFFSAGCQQTERSINHSRLIDRGIIRSLVGTQEAGLRVVRSWSLRRALGSGGGCCWWSVGAGHWLLFAAFHGKVDT